MNGNGSDTSQRFSGNQKGSQRFSGNQKGKIQCICNRQLSCRSKLSITNTVDFSTQLKRVVDYKYSGFFLSCRLQKRVVDYKCSGFFLSCRFLEYFPTSIVFPPSPPTVFIISHSDFAIYTFSVFRFRPSVFAIIALVFLHKHLFECFYHFLFHCLYHR